MGTTFLAAIRLLCIFFLFSFFFSIFFFFLNFERVPKPKMNLILSVAFLAIAASTIAIRAESDDVVEGEKSRAAVPLEVQREIKELTRKVDYGRCPPKKVEVEVGRGDRRWRWRSWKFTLKRDCCPHCHLCEYCDHCPRGSTKDPCRYCDVCPHCKYCK